MWKFKCRLCSNASPLTFTNVTNVLFNLLYFYVKCNKGLLNLHNQQWTIIYVISSFTKVLKWSGSITLFSSKNQLFWQISQFCGHILHLATPSIQLWATTTTWIYTWVCELPRSHAKLASAGICKSSALSISPFPAPTSHFLHDNTHICGSEEVHFACCHLHGCTFRLVHKFHKYSIHFSPHRIEA